MPRLDIDYKENGDQLWYVPPSDKNGSLPLEGKDNTTLSWPHIDASGRIQKTSYAHSYPHNEQEKYYGGSSPTIIWDTDYTKVTREADWEPRVCEFIEDEISEHVLTFSRSYKHKRRHPAVNILDTTIALLRTSGILAELEREFQELSDRWHEDTAMISSAGDMITHPAYQNIIGMGPAVVPLLLCELAKEPDHWFWALNAITKENPIQHEDEGDIDKMAKAWLDLGKERGWF